MFVLALSFSVPHVVGFASVGCGPSHSLHDFAGASRLDVGISCSSSRAILLRDGAVSIWFARGAFVKFVVGHSTPRQHRPPHSHLAPHRPLVNNLDRQYSVFLILIPLAARPDPEAYVRSPFRLLPTPRLPFIDLCRSMIPKQTWPPLRPAIAGRVSRPQTLVRRPRT